jgi:hypothetical protein
MTCIGQTRRPPLRAVFTALAVCVTGSLSVAEPAPDFSKLAPAVPYPALVAAARLNHIPLQPIEPSTNADKLVPGDTVSALVTLHQKGVLSQQWLFYLETVAPGPNDKLDQPRKASVFYCSTGEKMEFSSSAAWVTLRLLGPYADAVQGKKPPKPRDEQVRLALDQDYLALGLDQMVAAICRVRAAAKGTDLTNASFSMGSAPFPASTIAKGKVMAERLHLSYREQRAICGATPATLSYFNLVQATPRLKDILIEVLEKPSLWSLLGHLGVKANIRLLSEHIGLADQMTWDLPEHPPVYHLPLQVDLNDHPALRLTMVVTAPHPPLLACGGIIGMLAERPSEKETYLTLRILSARLSSH